MLTMITWLADAGWLRWTNVVLAMLAVILLVAAGVHRWETMPRRFQRITPWVIGTYVIIAYGSGEAAATGASPGMRVALLTLDLIGLIIAVLFAITEDETGETAAPRPLATTTGARHGRV